MMTKTCSHCGVTKPTSEFWKNRSKKDGLATWCSECHKAATRAWRRGQPTPPKPPKPLLTDKQIELVQLISKGYDVTELAAEMGISREAAKGRCRTVKDIFGVTRTREIPYAYWLRTGAVPFGSSGFEGRVGTSLAQVVEELFNKEVS